MHEPHESMVQLLTPDGERLDHPDFDVQLTGEDLRTRVREMWLGRRFDVEATALQRHGKLALWPPQLGQEATQVGAAHGIRDADSVFPTYREHSMALALGLPMRQLLAFFRGCDNGRWDRSERFRPYTVVIGAQTLHAVGYAMGVRMDGHVGLADATRNEAVLTFHGDGASAQGDVNEAYVFAASYHAPVVFLCQNNQWAISEPTTLQSRIPLFQRAAGFGFPGVQVDGNDVLAVEAVTRWAMDRARRGEGPALIEAFTYRMGAHTTSDDPTKYRTSAEEERWKAKDPIARVVAHLRGLDEIDDAWLAELEAEADELGATTRATVEALPDATIDSLYDHTFTAPTAELEAARAEHHAYVAGFEEA